jgi:hypothetical protein
MSQVKNAFRIDMTDLICSTAVCNVEKNGTLIFSDNNHLTEVFSRSLADKLLERLALDR